jgi:hypothetical protein
MDSRLGLTQRQSLFLKVLLGWVLLTSLAVTLVGIGKPAHRAMLTMAWGLILLWIVVGGGLMLRFRAPISQWVGRIPLDWRVKFVLFATLLALIEEAVTTAMTNLAPLLGVRFGQAYITASGSYLDVVALHSVSLFISFFVGWAVILSRYRFTPFEVFVLFGITGTLAEMSFGPQHALEFALWIYVYGLMVYLPACAVPPERPAVRPRWYHYPLAVIVPFLFLLLFPLFGIIHAIYPNHPTIHFPPMK